MPFSFGSHQLPELPAGVMLAEAPYLLGPDGSMQVPVARLEGPERFAHLTAWGDNLTVAGKSLLLMVSAFGDPAGLTFVYLGGLHLSLKGDAIRLQLKVAVVPGSWKWDQMTESMVPETRALAGS